MKCHCRATRPSADDGCGLLTAEGSALSTARRELRDAVGTDLPGNGPDVLRHLGAGGAYRGRVGRAAGQFPSKPAATTSTIAKIAAWIQGDRCGHASTTRAKAGDDTAWGAALWAAVGEVAGGESPIGMTSGRGPFFTPRGSGTSRTDANPIGGCLPGLGVGKASERSRSPLGVIRCRRSILLRGNSTDRGGAFGGWSWSAAAGWRVAWAEVGINPALSRFSWTGAVPSAGRLSATLIGRVLWGMEGFP